MEEVIIIDWLRGVGTVLSSRGGRGEERRGRMTGRGGKGGRERQGWAEVVLDSLGAGLT